MNAAVAHWAACCIVWEYCAGREGTFVTATWAQITQHTQDKSLQQVSGGNLAILHFRFLLICAILRKDSDLFTDWSPQGPKAWRPESMTSTLASQAGKKRPGSPIRGEILSLCQVEKRMPIFPLFRNIVKITGFGRKKSMHESLIIQLNVKKAAMLIGWLKSLYFQHS